MHFLLLHWSAPSSAQLLQRLLCSTLVTKPLAPKSNPTPQPQGSFPTQITSGNLQWLVAALYGSDLPYHRLQGGPVPRGPLVQAHCHAPHSLRLYIAATLTFLFCKQAKLISASVGAVRLADSLECSPGSNTTSLVWPSFISQPKGPLRCPLLHHHALLSSWPMAT